ncbi:MAG TPA: class I SAM-dependent methyltransferase [Acidimicrobiia bacterium]|nr:class I SAM-dependent methyltransferase [Acidimicrobiia bacterium]
MDRQAWDERYGGTDLVWSATPNQFLAAEAADLAAGRALDVACGEGRNALWLAGRGWQVTAVDFSEAGIATGRRRAAEAGVDVDWVVADVVEWEPEPAAFDLAVIAYLQLPAASLRRVISHAVGALGPGGTLVAVGHDRTNLVDGHGGPQDPDVLWTVDEIVEAIGASGIEATVEQGAVVERRVTTDDGERVALDTLVRATRS